MTYDSNNIFAKILAGKVPCDKVDENEFMVAFKDINPRANVHLLIIPKGEYVCYDDFIRNADHNHIIGFFKSVQNILDQFELDQKGYRLIMNSGFDGGQEVDHFHVHVLGGEKLKPF